MHGTRSFRYNVAPTHCCSIDTRFYATLVDRHTAQPIQRTPFRVQHPNTPLPLALAHYHTSLATPLYTQSSPINSTNAQARLVSP
jgi:hypothetical protein